MNTQIATIAILAILVAGTTIAGASAMYPYGANPSLMKNAQAQEDMVVQEPVNEMIVSEPVAAPEVCPPDTEDTGSESPMIVPEATPVVTPAEEQAVNETETVAEEVISAVNETDANSEEVEAVANATEEVVETVEETVEGGNVTETEVIEVSEEVVEAVDNATDGGEEAANDALIELLTGLVDAQKYNENLTEDEKADLQDNLDVVVQELG